MWIRFYLIFLFYFQILNAALIDTIQIKSNAMNIIPNAIIVTPDSYQNDDSSRYPVVYLLHGWSGNYLNWHQKSDLGLLADQYNLIIVCPDGGYAGWYINSPLIKESQYETYIANEVVEFIDKHYRTKNNMNNRAICGLSMGGHGAIRLISIYPQKFTAAGSMSGVMDLTESSQRYGIINLLGNYETNKDKWISYSCLNIVKKLAGKNKSIIIDCGVDDRFIQSNRKIHQIMLELNIYHDYYERPGGHSWEYWINALDYHIMYFSKVFYKNRTN